MKRTDKYPLPFWMNYPPEAKKAQPNSGNGGKGPNYVWTQTLSEITVTIPVPAETTSKQVKAQITDTTVDVRLTDGKILLEGKLYADVRSEESFWQLDRAEQVVTLHLDKRDDMNWWACVVKGHDEINISSIEPGNSRLDDLDGETRSMVEKMMYDQRQKAAGKPTSEEQQKMALFEKFKREHPEMDFSNAKFQ